MERFLFSFVMFFLGANTVVAKFVLSVLSLSLSLTRHTVILFFSAGNNLLLPKVWQQVDVSTIQRMGSSTSPFFLRQAIYTLPLQRKP